MIEFQNVHISYKDKAILNGVSLDIREGEFFVLIGSSGCGKTTLLKSINKLIPLEKGNILIHDEPIDQIKLHDIPKMVGYVVQSGGLFPHMTIEENISVIMEIIQAPKETIKKRVYQMLKMVNLDPEVYSNQYPSQLSGGQQQRVGIARAFASDPSIVLMDEPFSALDPMTRTELQNEIHDLQTKTNKTVVFVTHDMDEAIKLADRICIIQDGKIAQCDTPENILKHPASEYVANFIGSNRLWANPEYIRAVDIMRLRPFTISKGRTVIQALQIMKHNGVDSLLVVNKEKTLLGIIRLEDLIGKQSSDRVENYMTQDYIAVESNTTLKEIISNIDYEVSGIIPVIEQNKHLVGFLTKSSLLSTMSRQFVQEHNGVERSGVICHMN